MLLYIKRQVLILIIFYRLRPQRHLDALKENTDGALGIQKKAYLEKRIKMLDKDSQTLGKKAGPGLGKKIQKYNN